MNTMFSSFLMHLSGDFSSSIWIVDVIFLFAHGYYCSSIQRDFFLCYTFQV